MLAGCSFVSCSLDPRALRRTCPEERRRRAKAWKLIDIRTKPALHIGQRDHIRRMLGETQSAFGSTLFITHLDIPLLGGLLPLELPNLVSMFADLSIAAVAGGGMFATGVRPLAAPCYDREGGGECTHPMRGGSLKTIVV